ncbi:MAG: glucose 1-dehydrogenase [Planctomycetota bacterium]
MKAIALRKGAQDVELVDLPKPVPGAGEVLVKIIRCGLCGTDREIIRRGIPDVPPGEAFLVLGHEGLGRVVELGTKTKTSLRPGDLVTIMVRRGCGLCNACQTGHVDYCYTGQYTERGIHKAHGFFTEYIVEEPGYLVPVPPGLEDIGVLAEPMSVSAKAYQVAASLMGRVCFDGACSFRGRREKALVAGHGPIGVLAALLLLVEGFDVSVLGRRETGDPQRAFLESFGIRYLNAARDEDRTVVEKEGGVFLIIEATGLAELTFRLPALLGRNGILVLTGVPRGPQEIRLDGNRLMASLVRYNQTITGTVNASRDNFEMALRYLEAFKNQDPRIASRILTGRYTLSNWRDAFAPKSKDEIKAVIEFEPAA